MGYLTKLGYFDERQGSDYRDGQGAKFCQFIWESIRTSLLNLMNVMILGNVTKCNDFALIN